MADTEIDRLLKIIQEMMNSEPVIPAQYQRAKADAGPDVSPVLEPFPEGWHASP